MNHIIEIHAPATEKSVTKPIMVYDSKEHLINTHVATRAGVSCSDHHSTLSYTIWFDDGTKRYYMARIFPTKEEATTFLESIYNIKE
jgi:hypothetical protein